MTTEIVSAGSREVEISNADKVLFPGDGITKLDLAQYFARIAEIALRHWQDRPLTLRRFPDGIDQGGFFQKNVPDHFPDWITRMELPKKGGTVTHALATEPATAVYLADQGCVELHLALAHAGSPDRPDRMIFDLDPSDDDFTKVQEVARAVRKALEDRDLQSFVATTGSRGLHIVLPLDGSAHVDALRPFARGIAAEVSEAHPSVATTEQRKDKRGDRVLIDTFRTADGQTAIAPYGVRALPGAPVATPIRWEEAFASDLTPDGYTISSIFRRLGQMEDPWAEISDYSVAASALVERS
ncbi:MAG: non-homologous end-joining DNA ligase [Rhodobacteraceae bacterium]|uniref:non-homologous end-joining DNA ligase n=1 Tax=Marivita sp. TaxID=2003365 RepID=UPI003B52EC5F|nr:non-homologous end-joining DNA ligase [Paracoccaceae bacterium]